ncbi:MAG: anthranilate synthase component I family protein [Phycisphaerales bacterium]
MGDTSSLPTPPDLARPTTPRTFDAPIPDAEPNRAAYTAAVRRAIEYIRAGDIYQANLTHRLSTPFAGSARALFAALAAADPVHGVYLEADHDRTRTALCSASPELFLSYDPTTRRLTTRPMKGTRPHAADPAELRDAPKDRAELAMIVDLMRNDLGRVAEFGSVRVEAPRTIERHAQSVLQATATISATLRQDLTLADAITAAFPAGSVTGAPKIRAMQIIDELEDAARGPYCGSAGFIDDSGRAMLNVAIRTALITGSPGNRARDEIASGTLDYAVGAGIVADSDPDAEWDETLVKAGVLRSALTPRRADAPERPAPTTA